jgi:hypothetical protein
MWMAENTAESPDLAYIVLLLFIGKQTNDAFHVEIRHCSYGHAALVIV